MRTRSAIVIAATTLCLAGALWWAMSSLVTTRNLIRDRYAIRSVPTYLEAYARAHGGQLPATIHDLSDFLSNDNLADLEARVTMDRGLTASGLLDRESDLRSGAWRPVRLRDPSNSLRQDCSINSELLSLAAKLTAPSPAATGGEPAK